MGFFNLFRKSGNGAKRDAKSSDSATPRSQEGNPAQKTTTKSQSLRELQETYGRASWEGVKTQDWTKPTEVFLSLEKKGLSEASVALGQLFNLTDKFEANVHFHRGATMGNAEAAWGFVGNMGTDFIKMRMDGKFETWYKYCLQAARGGCPDAMHALGKMYYRQKDILPAFHWHLMGNFHEHAAAAMDLNHLIGEYRKNGTKLALEDTIVPELSEEDNKALLLIFSILGCGMPPTDNIIQAILRKGIKGGSVLAPLFYGFFFHHFGKSSHLGNARLGYQVAAQNGSIRGMRCLAEMMMTGAGGEANPSEAFNWYREAAKGGESVAAFITAQQHINRNELEMGAYWLAVSGRRGYDPAFDMLASLNL